MVNYIKNLKVELNTKIRKITDTLWEDIISTLEADGFKMEPMTLDITAYGKGIIYGAFNTLLTEMATDILNQTGETIQEGRLQWEEDLRIVRNSLVEFEGNDDIIYRASEDSIERLQRVMDQFGVEY